MSTLISVAAIVVVALLAGLGKTIISHKSQAAFTTRPGGKGYAMWASLKRGNKLAYGAERYMVTGAITYDDPQGHFKCYRYGLRDLRDSTSADLQLLIYRLRDGEYMVELLSPAPERRLSPEAALKHTEYRHVSDGHLLYTSQDGGGTYQFRWFMYGVRPAIPVLFEKFDDEKEWTVRQGQSLAIERLIVTY